MRKIGNFVDMEKMNYKYSLLVLFLFVFLSSVFAQKFEVSVDKTTVQQNERFQVYFTFDGGDRTSLQSFRPPNFKNFSVLSGPNQSSSMSIINGSVSSTITYSYIVIGPNIGEFTIESASVEHKGKVYRTDELKISVAKGATKSNNAKTNNQSMSTDELQENVFIRAIADKYNVVKGEQITVTYKLYTKLNISSPQISKLPQYKGFWAEALETGNNIQFEVEMYDGVRYRSAVLKKVALFPTKSGQLTVTPFELEIPVIVKKSQRNNDPFDSFFNDSFFGRTETIQFKAISNDVVINVSDLPTIGMPESFAGAVGEFSFEATLDKNKVKANEPVTLKLEVNGKGNIELIDLPTVKLPPGFEQYDPKSFKNVNNKGVVSGTKTEEYLIVPRVPGIKEIEPIKFSYFNPRLKKYIEETSSKFIINVGIGDSEYASTNSGFSKEDVKLLSQDIRFIQTSNFELVPKETGNIIKSWFWGMLIFPLFVMLITIGIKRRQDKLSGNVQLVKSRKAEKKAKLRLKFAQKALDENNLEKYYEEVSKGLFGYLEDKLQLQKAESSIEKVSSLLEKNGVNNELIKHVKDILEKCEFSRFAPQAQTTEIATDLYNETVNIIVEIENLVNSKKKK
ncbi:MAG: BatD family protein [Bacteroidetes bacterium]|nr:BatD family protein [Bacteroidota bacterium]MBU1116185.1 BatD family protein [Bacteroidota bacterium]MBU1799859.1 BatD family protein [Bacteroidota bacterium]